MQYETRVLRMRYELPGNGDLSEAVWHEDMNIVWHWYWKRNSLPWQPMHVFHFMSGLRFLFLKSFSCFSSVFNSFWSRFCIHVCFLNACKVSCLNLCDRRDNFFPSESMTLYFIQKRVVLRPILCFYHSNPNNSSKKEQALILNKQLSSLKCADD